MGTNKLDTDKTYTQDDIIAGIIRGDDAIIHRIYEENFELIEKLIESNGGNQEDSKDVFQEALVVLFRTLKENKFNNSSSISTFLYSVARLIWLKDLSRRKKQQLVFELNENLPDLETGIVSLIVKNEKYKLYFEKFNELSEDCKKVLRMSLNNVPIKEITRIMGYSSEQHTKNRRLRCKKSLINRIQRSDKFKELGNGTNQVD